MRTKKKKVTYTNSPIKPQEKKDRIVKNEAWLKGKTNTRPSWHIKLGDNVMVIRGKDKGQTGKVIKVIPREAKIIVEGINIQKKHAKLPTQQQGEIKEMPAPIWIWSVMHVVEQNGKKVGTRIKRDKDGNRISVKTGEKID